MRWTKERVGNEWIIKMFYTVYTTRGLEEREVESIIYTRDEKDADEIIQVLGEIYGKEGV